MEPKQNITMTILCLSMITVVAIQHQPVIAQHIQPLAAGGNILSSKILNIKASSHLMQPVNSDPLQLAPMNMNRDHHSISLNSNNINNLMTSANHYQSQHEQQTQPQSQQQQQQKQQTSTSSNAIITAGSYMKAVEDSLLSLRQALISKSFKFDGHFRDLVSKSKKDLHLMFIDTYGPSYERNTEIFTNMYGSLEQYYNEGKVNLTKSMDDFFANLYKRVFSVFNGHKKFTDQYLDCVSDRLNEMKPFKEVPEKLVRSIRYTFVAARTFSKSLNEGIDVLRSIIALVQSNQCTALINDKLIKTQQALTSNRQPICLPYCEQVILRCLGKDNMDQLNDKWRAYLQTLSDIASKLSTSYNIEIIIEPLNVQISEAIMNFQESAANITQRVYQVCGGATNEPLVGHLPIVQNTQSRHPGPRLQPTSIGRRNRRSANPNIQRTRQSTYKFTGYENILSQVSRHQAFDERTSSVDQRSSVLMDEIRKFLTSSRTFWTSLPNSVCLSVLGSNVTSTPTTSNSLGTSHKKQPTNCYSEPFSIMDVNLDLRFKTELLKQANHLDNVQHKLEDALRGAEVDWPSPAEQSNLNLNQKQSTTVRPQVVHFFPSTTASPIDVDTTDDDEHGAPDDLEEGSGCDPSSCSEQEPDCCEAQDSIDPTESPTDEETSTSTPFPDTPPIIPDPIDNNDIDKPSSISQPDQDNLVLITAPNQAGFQKSGQTSCKLVINLGSQLLLSSITSVALLFVTNFSTSLRFISPQAIR